MTFVNPLFICLYSILYLLSCFLFLACLNVIFKTFNKKKKRLVERDCDAPAIKMDLRSFFLNPQISTFSDKDSREILIPLGGGGEGGCLLLVCHAKEMYQYIYIYILYIQGEQNGGMKEIYCVTCSVFEDQINNTHHLCSSNWQLQQSSFKKRKRTWSMLY